MAAAIARMNHSNKGMSETRKSLVEKACEVPHLRCHCPKYDHCKSLWKSTGSEEQDRKDVEKITAINAKHCENCICGVCGRKAKDCEEFCKQGQLTPYGNHCNYYEDDKKIRWVRNTPFLCLVQSTEPVRQFPSPIDPAFEHDATTGQPLHWGHTALLTKNPFLRYVLDVPESTIPLDKKQKKLTAFQIWLEWNKVQARMKQAFSERDGGNLSKNVVGWFQKMFFATRVERKNKEDDLLWKIVVLDALTETILSENYGNCYVEKTQKLFSRWCSSLGSRWLTILSVLAPSENFGQVISVVNKALHERILQWEECLEKSCNIHVKPYPNLETKEKMFNSGFISLKRLVSFSLRRNSIQMVTDVSKAVSSMCRSVRNRLDHFVSCVENNLVKYDPKKHKFQNGMNIIISREMLLNGHKGNNWEPVTITNVLSKKISAVTSYDESDKRTRLEWYKEHSHNEVIFRLFGCLENLGAHEGGKISFDTYVDWISGKAIQGSVDYQEVDLYSLQLQRENGVTIGVQYCYDGYFSTNIRFVGPVVKHQYREVKLKDEYMLPYLTRLISEVDKTGQEIWGQTESCIKAQNSLKVLKFLSNLNPSSCIAMLDDGAKFNGKSRSDTLMELLKGHVTQRLGISSLWSFSTRTAKSTREYMDLAISLAYIYFNCKNWNNTITQLCFRLLMKTLGRVSRILAATNNKSKEENVSYFTEQFIDLLKWVTNHHRYPLDDVALDNLHLTTDMQRYKILLTLYGDKEMLDIITTCVNIGKKEGPIKDIGTYAIHLQSPDGKRDRDNGDNNNNNNNKKRKTSGSSSTP